MGKVLLLTITLLADTIMTAVEPEPDVVYVKSSRAGVFQAERGRIESLTETELLLRTFEGRYILLTRDAVKRVDLSDVTYQRHPQWEALVSEGWNTTTIVKIVQALPFVGSSLSVLHDVPNAIASTIAIIAFWIAVLWAVLKTYEIAIVSRSMRRLGRLKLQLEIAKLRNEAINLGTQQNDQWLPVLRDVELPFARPLAQDDASLARHRGSRILELVGGLFMSRDDRAAFRAICAAEVAVWLERGRERAKKARLWRAIGLGVGIAASIFLGFSLVPLSITRIYEGYGILNPIFEGTVGLLLLRQAVRLTMKLRDVWVKYRVLG